MCLATPEQHMDDQVSRLTCWLAASTDQLEGLVLPLGLPVVIEALLGPLCPNPSLHRIKTSVNTNIFLAAVKGPKNWPYLKKTVCRTSQSCFKKDIVMPRQNVKKMQIFCQLQISAMISIPIAVHLHSLGRTKLSEYRPNMDSISGKNQEKLHHKWLFF